MNTVPLAMDDGWLDGSWMEAMGVRNIAVENHHFYWENPRFLWSFSIGMFSYQRVLQLNLAMENHCLNRSITYFYGPFSIAMLNYPQGIY